MRILIRCLICVSVAWLMFEPYARAQRHGCADSVQNYAKSMRAIDPELALNLGRHQWIYVHLSELRQMQRPTVHVTDSHTQSEVTYEGVQLRSLVPKSIPKYRFEVFTPLWAFRDKRVEMDDELGPDAEPLIVDTVNFRKRERTSPFLFLCLNRTGKPILVKKLAFVRIVTDSAP